MTNRRHEASATSRRPEQLFSCHRAWAVNQEGNHYDTELRRNRITRWTTKVMRSAGIEGASFHTLRHTAASFMVQAGVPLYDVQKVLGHSTPLMAERYAHLQPDHLQGAVRALDQALSGLDTRVSE